MASKWIVEFGVLWLVQWLVGNTQSAVASTDTTCDQWVHQPTVLQSTWDRLQLDNHRSDQTCWFACNYEFIKANYFKRTDRNNFTLSPNSVFKYKCELVLDVRKCDSFSVLDSAPRVSKQMVNSRYRLNSRLIHWQSKRKHANRVSDLPSSYNSVNIDQPSCRDIQIVLTTPTSFEFRPGK